MWEHLRVLNSLSQLVPRTWSMTVVPSIYCTCAGFKPTLTPPTYEMWSYGLICVDRKRPFFHWRDISVGIVTEALEIFHSGKDWVNRPAVKCGWRRARQREPLSRSMKDGVQWDCGDDTSLRRSDRYSSVLFRWLNPLWSLFYDLWYLMNATRQESLY